MSQFEINGPNFQHFGMFNQLDGQKEVYATGENQGEVVVKIHPFYSLWLVSVFGLKSSMILDMTITSQDDECDGTDDDNSNDNSSNNYCTCCGKGNQKRIVGGTVAEKHEYPWHIGIQHISKDHPHCGGTIISPSYVITAAHCMQYPAQVIEVLIAEHDTANKYESQHFYRAAVEDVIIHQGYNAATINNDIALLKLKEPIEFSDHVYPAFLSQSEPKKGDSVVATGWGHTTYQGTVSNVLREVDLTVQGRKECEAAFANVHSFTLTSNMICANGSGKDACQGDSGGKDFLNF